MRSRILHLMLGLDKAITITLLNRGWGLVAGPVTLVLLIAYLNPDEQGFYFTMNSLLGLQVVFEMGLGFVVLQTVSHMAPSLRLVDDLPTREITSSAKLGRFLCDLTRWYVIIISLFVIGLLIGGSYFLIGSEASEGVQWEISWLLAVTFFGGNIFCNALFSFMEGIGQVTQVAMGRLMQAVVSAIVLWLSLWLDLKLLALGLMQLASFVVAALWLMVRYGNFLAVLVAEASDGERINWRNDIWPFQWRIALSWISGYLGSQAIVPIAFVTLGAVASGRIGLSITIMSAASAAAMAWVTTKSSAFGRLVAESDYKKLNQLFGHAYNVARVVACAASGVVVIIVAVLHLFQPEYAARFVPLVALVMLSVTAVFNVQTSAQAIYLRAFLREPFLAVSVASGFAMVLSVIFLARLGDITLVIGGYTAVTVLIALAWASPVFKYCKANYTRAK